MKLNEIKLTVMIAAVIAAMVPVQAADKDGEKGKKPAKSGKSGKKAGKGSAAQKVEEKASGGGFRKELSMQGVTFRIESANRGSENRVTVTPTGLAKDNAVVSAEADGTVVGAEVADLDADGSPEVYVYTRSAGSGSYGAVLAWAANRKQTLSAVTMPDLMADKVAAAGYGGHDEFAVVESSLVRRFKVMRPGDANASPTGKVRQIPYRLEAGEAGWVLRAGKPEEF